MHIIGGGVSPAKLGVSSLIYDTPPLRLRSSIETDSYSHLLNNNQLTTDNYD
jgi:hypothetical protein